MYNGGVQKAGRAFADGRHMMSEVTGYDQFSIKTRGYSTTAPQEYRDKILDRAMEKYEGEGFEIREKSQDEAGTPSVVVAKESSPCQSEEIKLLEVDPYGALLVEDIISK